MMPLLTQNVQSNSTLKRMIENAFPHKRLKTICELTEGFFNIAYLVSFQDGSESVLKIAPHPETVVMFYEKDIMATEVQCMELIAKKTSVPLPKLQFSDFSCTICNAPYFFMEKIEGNSLSTKKESLTENEINTIYHEVGKFNKQINVISNSFFGYPNQPALQGNDWYGVFRDMMNSLVQDAQRVKLELSIPSDEMFALLERDKPIFLEVQMPQLVHWDIWDGNIFVKDGKITGIIDWERCLWGDILMEVGFRSYSQSADFLAGYGVSEFTYAEKKRILWYDLFLLIIAEQEQAYRGYETANTWATEVLIEKFEELRKQS